MSADTIVPDPTNPQAYNRYSYGYNNPLLYTDPTGHCGALTFDGGSLDPLCAGALNDAARADPEVIKQFGHDFWDLVRDGAQNVWLEIASYFTDSESDYNTLEDLLGDILTGNTMMSLDGSSGGEHIPFNPNDLQQVANMLQEQLGVFIWMDEASEAFLGSSDVARYEQEPKIIILPQNPSRTMVVEELLHVILHRDRGWRDIRDRELIEEEIAVQDILLDMGQRLNWTESELQTIRIAKDAWERDLSQYPD